EFDAGAWFPRAAHPHLERYLKILKAPGTEFYFGDKDLTHETYGEEMALLKERWKEEFPDQQLDSRAIERLNVAFIRRNFIRWIVLYHNEIFRTAFFERWSGEAGVNHLLVGLQPSVKRLRPDVAVYGG